jgi:transposase InsO family protein
MEAIAKELTKRARRGSIRARICRGLAGSPAMWHSDNKTTMISRAFFRPKLL